MQLPNAFFPQKPKRVIDQVAEKPFDALKEVFIHIDRDFLRHYLYQWLKLALLPKEAPYDDAQSRMQLVVFYDEFKLLIEALFILYESREQPEEEFLEEVRRRISAKIDLRPVSHYVYSNPGVAINEFCKKFTIEYVRRELWDWFYSVVMSEANTEPAIDSEHALYAYQWFLLLAETAFAIAKKDI